MPKLRIIIGQGTAAETFQATVGDNTGEYRTIVIGARGLWTVLPQTHRMGQPSHLLTLPTQNVPQFQAPSGQNPQGLALFMDVNSYQQGLNNLAQVNRLHNGRIEYPGLTVTRVDPHRLGGIRVLCQGRGHTVEFRADQVIFASGIGPQQLPGDAGITVVGNARNDLGFNQIEEGIDYLSHADQVGRDVIVYGGGATGAWVAHEVRARSLMQVPTVDHWAWMARPGGRGFDPSTLPGDRNWEVLQDDVHKVRYSITRAEYVAPGSFRAPSEDDPGFPRAHKVKLTLVGESGFAFPYYADQLIYCLGGNPAARGSIAEMLDPGILQTMQPLRDYDRMVSDGTGTLAWCTPDRSVIIVGAATYNFASAQYNKAKQPAPMSGLPTNAQVADGIAVTVSVIEALNHYVPVSFGPQQRRRWTLNFNTSNRTQIAVYLAAETDLEPLAANIAVALIEHFRSRGQRPFGLTPQQVQFLLDTSTNWVRIIRQVEPRFEQLRFNVERNDDRPGGADRALDIIIASLTGGGYQQTWARAGL